MSPQDSLTSTRQGKANWNSRRPLSLVCARIVGEPVPVWPSLPQPASPCVQAAKRLKGLFHGLQSGAVAAPSLALRIAWLACCPA